MSKNIERRVNTKTGNLPAYFRVKDVMSEIDYNLTVQAAINELKQVTGVTDLMKTKDPERYEMLMNTFRDIAEKTVASEMI